MCWLFQDVCELKLTKNTSYDRSCLGKADTYVDTQASEYICPITGLEMNGRYKLVHRVSCTNDQQANEIPNFCLGLCFCGRMGLSALNVD